MTVLIILLITIQLALSFYYTWAFTTDDAFISWRYAQQLVDGHGLRWHTASLPVEGYSNFAWVLLAALFIKLGSPLIIAVKYFSCLSLVAALFFLYQLARTLLPPLLATLPVYLFSHYMGLAWWATSGLETSFFIAMILFTSWQCVHAAGFSKLSSQNSAPTYRPRAVVLSCLGLLALALIRFEGIVWCMIAMVFFICTLSHPARRLACGMVNHYRSMFLIVTCCLILPYCCYLLWRFLYFGQLLPNSYLCKMAIDYYNFMLVNNYLHIAFPCLIASLPYLLAKKDCRHLLLWLPSLIYCLLLWRADPVIAEYNRLFLGAFSLLSILPVLGMREFFAYFTPSAKINELATTVVLLLFTYVFIPGIQINDLKAAVAHYQQRSFIRLQVAKFLNTHAAANATILLADNGIIPFYSAPTIHFIDSQCLNNKDMTSPVFQHSLNLYASFMQQTVKPDWVIDSYYPPLHKGNNLNEVLRTAGFFKDYRQVASFQAHEFSSQEGKPTETYVDFVYYIYKRVD